MRLFEILIALILAVYFGWPLLPVKRARWLDALPLAALLASIVQILVEGYRWQMFPLYALVGVALLMAAFRLARGDNQQSVRRGAQVGGGLVGLVVLGLAVALPVLFPVPSLPEPDGPFAVGTETLYLVDTNRQEIYGSQPGGPRELMVQLWYPAESKRGAQTASWIEHSNVIGKAISAWLELPSFTLDHLKYARTNAYVEVPLAGTERFPVLLFSHGWGGFRAQNTYQLEELASQGFVVAAVEHPYGAVTTVFPDGRVAQHDPKTLPPDLDGAAYLLAANRLIKQWSGDLEFVLDSLTRLDASDPQGYLTNRLDLAKVGALGHSTGGGAALEFCAIDTRCKAVLGMDAYLAPVSESTLANGLDIPALLLFSELWPSADNQARVEELLSHMQAPAQVLTILGTDHYDFTDLPLLSPLAAQIGLKGPLKAGRVVEIVKTYSTAFFEQALRGQENPLLAGPSGLYPEVQYGAAQ